MGAVGVCTALYRPRPLALHRRQCRIWTLRRTWYGFNRMRVARGVAEDDSVCRAPECRSRQLTSMVTDRGGGDITGSASQRTGVGQPVVSIGRVDAGRRDLGELLAVGGDGVGEVDDVEDLGADEAGDQHVSRNRQARCGRPGAVPQTVAGEPLPPTPGRRAPDP